jgi:hypothetical protein
MALILLIIATQIQPVISHNNGVNSLSQEISVSLEEAIEVIDTKFGPGYAKANPLLVGDFIKAYAIMNHTDVLSDIIPVAVQSLLGELSAENSVMNALYTCADAQRKIARQLQQLGNGNAATEMGAIEAMTVQLSDSLHAIADSLSEIRNVAQPHTPKRPVFDPNKPCDL